MIILDVEQYSPEWWEARLGIPTASEFGSIITGEGKASQQKTKYRNVLLAEWLSGEPGYQFSTKWTQRGSELEPEARDYYEFHCDVEVQQVGLCYQDEGRKWACSPDGLVGESGGCEIKCPAPHTHAGYLLGKKLPTIYVPQVQGSLWITGRDWWDFLSYCPGLPPLLIRVTRDEAYIGRMNKALTAFVDNLNMKKEQLKEYKL